MMLLSFIHGMASTSDATTSNKIILKEDIFQGDIIDIDNPVD